MRSLPLMLLLTALTPSLGKLRYLKTYFLSKDHELEEERFLNDTVASRSRLLTPPSFLDSNTTAKQAVDKQQNGESDRLAAGILVENYSKYYLTDPKTTGTSVCTANKEVNGLMRVEPGSSELFIVHNEGTDFQGVCGAVTWTITKPDGTPVLDRAGKTGKKKPKRVGRRLVVTYYVPWSGECGESSGRFNAFSVNVWHVRLGETNRWLDPEQVEYRFEIEQSHVGTADYVSDGSKAFSLFDKGRFLVKATMERGCKPILKVQFLPGSWNGEMLWDQSAQLRPTRVNKPATQSQQAQVEHRKDAFLPIKADTTAKTTSPRPSAIKANAARSSPESVLALNKVIMYSLLCGIVLVIAVVIVTAVKRLAQRGQRSAPI